MWIMSTERVCILILCRLSLFCGNIHVPWILSELRLFYLSHFIHILKVTGAINHFPHAASECLTAIRHAWQVIATILYTLVQNPTWSKIPGRTSSTSWSRSGWGGQVSSCFNRKLLRDIVLPTQTPQVLPTGSGFYLELDPGLPKVYCPDYGLPLDY